MKVLEECVKFELVVTGGPSPAYSIVEFVHNNDEGRVPGVTNEEVVSMMLERFYGFQRNHPEDVNAMIIGRLKEIQKLLKLRRDAKYGKNNSRTDK